LSTTAARKLAWPIVLAIVLVALLVGALLFLPVRVSGLKPDLVRAILCA
jgi:hypothetical protein